MTVTVTSALCGWGLNSTSIALHRSAVVRQIGLTQMVRCMSIAPDGHHYAFGGQRGSVFLVDPLTGVWSELTGHTSHVGALAFRCGHGVQVI